MKKIIKNSKVLVTGGAGFLGSNLNEYFLNRMQYKALKRLAGGITKT